MTCNTCNHLKHIHPMVRMGKSFQGRCVIENKIVVIDAVNCENFKKFVGWVYR